MGDVAPPLSVELGGDRWRCRAYLGDEWQSARLGQPAEPRHGGWLPASVPGSVVADLVRAGQVPYPYRDLDSRCAEWAADRWWAYQTDFQATALAPDGRVDLVVEGLDYAGRVYLDGELLGEHTGMFVPARFEVADSLRARPGSHVLTILIAPAPHEESQSGDTARVRTHKARMTYGWDFCPRLVHQGIWQPVWLRYTGPARVERPFLRPRLVDGHRSAWLHCSLQLDTARAGRAEVNVAVSLAGTQVARAQEKRNVRAGVTTVELELVIDRPALWWPNGYGDQPLYDVWIAVDFDGRRSDTCTLMTGIRSLRLERNAGAPPDARPYRLVVNDVPVYINGWNWVPIDVLYGVPQPAKLSHLLRLAQAAHVNLLRVWGGGLIESQAFYEACDRLGILVWQEFIQSSSGAHNAPSGEPEFVAMMVREAEQVVPRRRNHPSLALWSGGNELMGDGQPLDESAPVLGALRDVVAGLDPDRPFLPTSPSGPIANFVDVPAGEVGHDVHGPWEHQGLNGQQALYDGRAALLHSEFGVEGMASHATLEATISENARWPPTRDNPVYAHRGAWWINEPLVQATFGGNIADLPTLVRASQLLQADGLRYAVEAHGRRRWLSAGTLPWQLNEPFPNAWCTSVVDYFGRPKPAYHAVAAAYEPLHLSAAFERQAWAGLHDFAATVWVTSTLRHAVPGRLVARCIAADGCDAGRIERRIACPPLASAALGELIVPLADVGSDLFLLDLMLSAADDLSAAAADEPLARTRYLFSRTDDLAPLRSLPATKLEVAREDLADDRWLVRLRNAGDWVAPVLRLEDARAAVARGWAYALEDHVTLLPGEQRQVEVVFDGVPHADRRVQISGWNVAERLVD